MSNFEDQIKRWVVLDNQVRVLAEQTKTLKKEKDTTESFLLDYADSHQLSNATVNISDGRLRFVTTKQTGALTLGYIEKCLRKCLPEPKEALTQQIMKVIKEDREVKEVPDIKRYKK